MPATFDLYLCVGVGVGVDAVCGGGCMRWLNTQDMQHIYAPHYLTQQPPSSHYTHHSIPSLLFPPPPEPPERIDPQLSLLVRVLLGAPAAAPTPCPRWPPPPLPTPGRMVNMVNSRYPNSMYAPCRCPGHESTHSTAVNMVVNTSVATSGCPGGVLGRGGRAPPASRGLPRDAGRVGCVLVVSAVGVDGLVLALVDGCCCCDCCWLAVHISHINHLPRTLTKSFATLVCGGASVRSSCGRCEVSRGMQVMYMSVARHIHTYTHVQSQICLRVCMYGPLTCSQHTNTFTRHKTHINNTHHPPT